MCFLAATLSPVQRSFFSFVETRTRKIIANAVIYWFMLPLCVYLQYVPVLLPSYTPRQLAYVNLLLT